MPIYCSNFGQMSMVIDGHRLKNLLKGLDEIVRDITSSAFLHSVYTSPLKSYGWL